MAPPLVTLLSAESEIQYVAVRNINLVVQKCPAILTNEIKVFFCGSSISLSGSSRSATLSRFYWSSSSLDVGFVRAIDRCAVKLERAEEKCISIFAGAHPDYIVQEAIIAIKDTFQKNLNQYESIIATLCENLDMLEDKASMISSATSPIL
ncbi:hypothetical protein V7S43_004067 [Phytophthora oleae]|uniref:Uncharacterized protein n=1 Tax=Phytophthora oleae TaxID=2107226 RepID=A0ABD3FY37_9STRA